MGVIFVFVDRQPIHESENYSYKHVMKDNLSPPCCKFHVLVTRQENESAKSTPYDHVLSKAIFKFGKISTTKNRKRSLGRIVFWGLRFSTRVLIFIIDK